MQVLAKACSQVTEDDTWNTEGDRSDLAPKEYALFFQIADFFIFTEKIGSKEPVSIYRLPGMRDDMVCISGDKGDASQLLGLPLILFDDKADNLDDVIRKGHTNNVGVLVRRGEAVGRSLPRKCETMVINDPHDWVYWSWQFARRYPQPRPLDDWELREHGETDD